MRILFARPALQRRPLQRVLLGIGVVAVVGVAAIGAVLGVVLLTLGALAHFGYRGLRAALAPRVSSQRTGEVIEGEYRVVARAPVRTLPRIG